MASESMLKRYSSSHAVYDMNYHIVFCPKFRRPVLAPLEGELRELFNDVARNLEIQIQSMEIMPDHVHLFIKVNPSLIPQFIVNQFKGYTSKILRDRHLWLRKRLPTLWTRSYYIGTVGHMSYETVQKYIENQKGK